MFNEGVHILQATHSIHASDGAEKLYKDWKPLIELQERDVMNIGAMHKALDEMHPEVA